MEAVQIAAGLLEILDPFLRLLESVSRCVSSSCRNSCFRKSLSSLSFCLPVLLSGPYLGDHHVAVEGAFSVGFSWPVDVRANLGDDGSSEGDVRHEMAVHDVDV